MTDPMTEDIVIQYIVETVKAYASVKKAWLYGSRARGDASTISDYDLAFEWNDSGPISWGAFTTFLRENNPSLNSLDISRIDELGSSLRDQILKGGRIFYEQV